MGGTDDPSNLVRLTVEEHAEAHRLLYVQNGREHDRIAWLGLSNQISKQDAIRLAMSEGAKNGIRMYPEKSSAGGTALWNKSGMRVHLSQKRKEQSRQNKNPMQGKKQLRVCCVCCKKDIAVNTLTLHLRYKKCDNFSVARKIIKPLL